MRIFAACLFALLFIATSPVRAAALNPGDAAPALDVGKWMQGEAVPSFEKGKIYVVEFWATWCGPCRATIPHLTELSKSHADVTFIGVDVWEEDEKLVEPFIKEMGPKMTYRVATDNKAKLEKGAMAVTWMEAAGQNGIPTAFIIDKDSKIAWIGHPGGMEKPLDAIVAGKFDLKAEAARAAAEKEIETEVKAKILPAMQAGEFDKAEAALNEIIKAHPDQKSKLLRLAVGIKLQKKDMAGAYEALDAMTADADAATLNEIAFAVLTDDAFAAKRDADRAIKWATKSVELTGGKEAPILDTLARAYAVKGDFDKAAETQQKAVDLADDNLKPELQKTLAAYKEKKLPEVK